MKGSTWHRWDLHYHTPSSYDYKNSSKTNQLLVKELIDDGVSAVVVTDHHRIDFARIKELNDLAADKVKFFRGIELTSELGGSESVHFIAIFPETLPDDIIRDSFLAPLGITEEKTNRDPSLLSKALPYSEFLRRAKEIGAITSVHAGKKSNSIENIRNWGLSKPEFKKELLERVDILETGRKDDIKDYTDIVFKSIGKVCPVVICSDYHSEYGYREYMDNKTTPPTKVKRDATWIKGDLTFEGLKQIIYEPALRVRIQEENPKNDKLGSKIESIQIKDCKLFKEKTINFNSDMIAIIGEKGSGKTALLDMVASALGTGSSDQPSFVQRAKSELKNSKLLYNLYGDDTHEISVLENSAKTRCRYINPTRLSSFCENEYEMQEFIKSILVHKDIEQETELNTKRSNEIQSSLLKIHSLNEKISYKNDIIQKIKDLKGKISTEEKNKPSLPTVDESVKAKFLELRQEIDKKAAELKKVNASYVSIFKFNSERLTLLSESAEVVRRNLYESISDIIKYEDFNLVFSYSEDTLKVLDAAQEKYRLEKETLAASLQEKTREYETLKTEIFKSIEQQTRYENWQKYYDQLLNELKRLNAQKEYISSLEKEKAEIFNQCISLMHDIVQSKKKILKYYHDLKALLDERIGSVEKNKIAFNPTFKILTEELFRKLELILSLKSINEETLKINLNSKYVRAVNKTMDAEESSDEGIKNLIDLFVNADAKKNLYGKTIESKIFKAGHSDIELYKVAFSDFIDINYAITFNGIPMDQLSSGQKGIVLLKLLLRLDPSTDPLLIDQPEDNLDNKSVYDQLVEEFKNLKNKRQLFIATHNPNLVINTDSEQVIVAEYKKGAKDGYISYSSGSIENPDIREQICRILEGGKDAFINRERRYDFRK